MGDQVGRIKGVFGMSCDLVEIRLNSGLVISLYDDSHMGWFKDKRPSERELWERMAFLIRNTDFEAVKKLYGTLPPPKDEDKTPA